MTYSLGRFNTSTLALLRHSDVVVIDLSSSLAPEDGLNLGGRQMLQGNAADASPSCVRELTERVERLEAEVQATEGGR